MRNAVQELVADYEQEDAAAQDRACRLRVGAQLAPASGSSQSEAERPCTLPYTLLDESLELSDISYVGPGLLYQAHQLGAQKRRVLIKFVAGRYGEEVRVVADYS